MHRVRGGHESDKELSKREVEAFAKGHVRAPTAVARPDGASPTVGGAAKNEVEYVRKDGPDQLAEDSAYRSALPQEAET